MVYYLYLLFVVNRYEQAETEVRTVADGGWVADWFRELYFKAISNRPSVPSVIIFMTSVYFVPFRLFFGKVGKNNLLYFMGVG